MMSREQTMALLEGTTPGPWSVERQAVAHVLSCGDKPGYISEACFVMPMRLQVYGPDWKHDGDVNRKGNPYICKNAALIASAPALAASHLAALDEVERLKQALWLTMHRVEEAAKMFHNTQQWDEVEWGDMVLADWIFEPARAALEDRT